jgi:hypothetical protein
MFKKVLILSSVVFSAAIFSTTAFAQNDEESNTKN